MIDSELPHTLISYDAVNDAALRPSGSPKAVLAAEVNFTWSERWYTVPMVDCQGRTQLLKARGVEYIVYSGAAAVPPKAAVVFPEMAGEAWRAHQREGIVQVTVRCCDNLWCHPQRVCESPSAEENMSLFSCTW